MIRFLLFLLFFVMLVADPLGLDRGLAPGLSIKNAFIYLLFAALAIETALKQNRRIEFLSVFLPYTVCFFYATISVIVVALVIKYHGYSWLEALIDLKSSFADNLLVLLIFFYGVLRPENALQLLKMMIWAVLLANFVTIIDTFFGLDLGFVQEGKEGRIGGPIGEPNQYAAFLALYLPLIAGLAILEQGTARVLAVLGLIISALAFLMTASRGGIAGIVIGSGLGALYLRQYVKAQYVGYAFAGLIALLPIAAVALYYAGFGDVLYERFIELSGARDTWALSSGRTDIWGAAFSKMFDQPVSLITGFGWDAYKQAFIFRYAPHNTYLKYFFELGAIGLVLVMITFINVLLIARRSLSSVEPERAKMLIAFVFGQLSFMIAVFFVDITSRPWILVWATFGVMLRVAIDATRSAEQPTGERKRTAPKTSIMKLSSQS